MHVQLTECVKMGGCARTAIAALRLNTRVPWLFSQTHLTSNFLEGFLFYKNNKIKIMKHVMYWYIVSDLVKII